MQVLKLRPFGNPMRPTRKREEGGPNRRPRLDVGPRKAGNNHIGRFTGKIAPTQQNLFVPATEADPRRIFRALSFLRVAIPFHLCHDRADYNGAFAARISVGERIAK